MSPLPDADVVVDLARSRPSRAGATRIVCVDGPAGSGKTTLAGLVAESAARQGLSTAQVHLDDLYAGWDGLPEAGDRVRRLVVDPLARGETGRYRRYDWDLAEWAEEHEVPAVDLLVLEGVGSGHAGYADLVCVLVWVEAPPDVRLRRGLERDGAALEERWRTWMVAEQEVLTRDRSRARADLVVDGTTGEVRRA